MENMYNNDQDYSRWKAQHWKINVTLQSLFFWGWSLSRPNKNFHLYLMGIILPHQFQKDALLYTYWQGWLQVWTLRWVERIAVNLGTSEKVGSHGHWQTWIFSSRGWRRKSRPRRRGTNAAVVCSIPPDERALWYRHLPRNCIWVSIRSESDMQLLHCNEYCISLYIDKGHWHIAGIIHTETCLHKCMSTT